MVWYQCFGHSDDGDGGGGISKRGLKIPQITCNNYVHL